MKAYYERQIKSVGVIEYGDGEVVKVLASEVEEGKFEVWHRAGGILDRINGPANPMNLAEAQQMAVNYVLREETKGKP